MVVLCQLAIRFCLLYQYLVEHGGENIHFYNSDNSLYWDSISEKRLNRKISKSATNYSFPQWTLSRINNRVKQCLLYSAVVFCFNKWVQADWWVLLQLWMCCQDRRLCWRSLCFWVWNLLHYQELWVWGGGHPQLQPYPEHRLSLRLHWLHHLSLQPHQTQPWHLFHPAGVRGVQPGPTGIQHSVGLQQGQAGVHHPVLPGSSNDLWL